MKKIAVVGSGISGLTCAYYLSKQHDVTVFEAADYIGGHTHTVRVDKKDETSWIDTGFIVFNDRTYPNFLKLMTELGVAYQPTEMSFSVRNDTLDLEYGSRGLNALFAQRSNLVSPRFYKMLLDLLRFNREVRKKKEHTRAQTIGNFLQSGGYGDFFRDNYILPMISAIWSMGHRKSLDFPLQFFARFFDNHGLLTITDQPQWYTIMDGSSSYIEPLTIRYKKKIYLKTPVLSVARQNSGVKLETHSGSHTFDEVILACHGDQALALLSEPTEKEHATLAAFGFSNNKVVLHTDTAHLPNRKAAWASWNYRMVNGDRERTTLTYNMNILQRLNKQHTYLVTLNQDIDTEKISARFTYRHPVYTTDAIDAQNQWHEISGADRIHYCGAYWFNGFHEDGVKSALRVCAMLEALS